MRGLRVTARALLVCALAAVGLLAVGVPPAAAGATLNVGSGQPFATIQSAVNAAKSGDLIVVMPGTYNESVVITKNGLTIRGALNQPLPIVQPPSDASGCETAEGSPDGFCIFPPGPGTINNTEIARLWVRNFEATGIIAFGATGLNVHDVKATDNGEYGIARFDSSHTQIVNNYVSGSGEAGIYNGDSPDSSSLIRLNTVENNGFGIFIRDSAHGTVTENTATGNCIGILLLDSAENPAPTFDWTLVHNKTDNNTSECEGPPISGIGLAVAGAAHSRLTANESNGNNVGLVVLSNAAKGGADPSYVQIDNNQLVNNNVQDIFYDGSGTAVVFAHNTCTGGPC